MTAPGGGGMTALQAELGRHIIAASGEPAAHTAIEGVTLHAVRAPSAPVSVVFPPTLYVVVQGAKRLMLGDREVTYGGGELVLMSLDLPALVQVTTASPGAPYLSVEIALDQRVLSSLAADVPPCLAADRTALTTSPLPEPVLEATLRLVRLMSDAAGARVLADGVKREVLYRVLTSPGGGNLLQLLQVDSTLARIGRATQWMHDHLDTPVRIDQLADRAAMSVTTFHRGFKIVTGTTPGQYHKLMRLQEARRLVATRADTLTRIATAVGYASPSQFSREYKRTFGAAPVVDARRFD